MQLAVYVDDSKQDAFPDKSKYYFDKVVCDNNSTWEFDYEKWELTLTTNKEDKCNIYFTKNYRDKSGANAPELYQGLIPIYFNEANEMLIADVEKEWYDYDKHNWGNAVLIDNEDEQIRNKFYKEDGTLKANEKITEEDILQMYVWIPRYKYELFNAVAGETAEEQMINIKFEKEETSTGTVTCKTNTLGQETCENAKNGNWYTHPAFTFGETELEGFWVGKFEPSDPKDPNGRLSNQIKEITILPDKTSMVLKQVKTMFDAEQKLTEEGNKYNLKNSEVDTHMAKNSEWGAIAYLTSSKYGIYTNYGTGCVIDGMNKDNCEVWINNTAQGTGYSGKNTYGGTHTGCVGASVSALVQWNTADDGSEAKCDADKVWNTGGVKASTTGNMYGIYDMAGGTHEYVMGVTENKDGTEPNYASSGFSKTTMPDSKYYDLYEFSESNITHERGHFGDATRETLKTLDDTLGGWNSDYSYFPRESSSEARPWFVRSGIYDGHHFSGIFAYSYWDDGTATRYTSFRSVLSAA